MALRITFALSIFCLSLLALSCKSGDEKIADEPEPPISDGPVTGSGTETESGSSDIEQDLGGVIGGLFGSDEVDRAIGDSWGTGGLSFQVQRVSPQVRRKGELFEVAVGAFWSPPSDALPDNPAFFFGDVSTTGAVKVVFESTSDWLRPNAVRQSLGPQQDSKVGKLMLTCADVGPGSYGAAKLGYYYRDDEAILYVYPTSMKVNNAYDPNISGSRTSMPVGTFNVLCIDSTSGDPPTPESEDIIEERIIETEDGIAITTVKLGDGDYPVVQFVPDDKGPITTLTLQPGGGFAISIDSPDESDWLKDPDPDGFNFGKLSEAVVDTQFIPRAEWNRFCDSVIDAFTRNLTNNAIAEACGVDISLDNFCDGVDQDTEIAHYSPVREFCEGLVEPAPIPTSSANLAGGNSGQIRPTATPAKVGVRVEVIKIGDAHYYRYMMNETDSPGNYECGGEYSMHIAQPYTEIRSFEYPDEPIIDLNPFGCGFGPTVDFTVDGEVVTPQGVISPEFPEMRFTAKVIGEWCRQIKWDTEPQNRAVENLCQRNPPQD